MITRYKLERCRALRKGIDHVKERLKEISPRLAIRIDYVSRGSGSKGQPTETEALDRLSLEEYMTDLRREYKSLADDIATATVNLDPMLREVILMRYVDGNEWDEVSRRLRYAESYVYHLHQKALQAILRQ